MIEIPLASGESALFKKRANLRAECKGLGYDFNVQIWGRNFFRSNQVKFYLHMLREQKKRFPSFDDAH
jgi:hypothetical protein